MSLNQKFPYVEGHPTESDAHLRLKGLAVYWLMEKAFELSDIEEEHTVEKTGRGGYGYTDIYASQGGVEVFIECDNTSGKIGSLSYGGRAPLRKGKDVYVFTHDGIHKLGYIEVTCKNRMRDEHAKTEKIKSEYVENLPMLDLSDF